MKQLVLFLVLVSGSVYAQSQSAISVQQTTATILHLDSLFWQAYNSCDTLHVSEFFTGDVEFYHDKGGITVGAGALTDKIRKNLCRNPDYHLRREEVKGTVQVFPLQNGNDVYGAVISGEHVFYVWEKGKAEFPDGHASFTHLWLLENGMWKMARILSYDHH